MAVLVDTSVWIDFRVGSKSIELDDLIDENIIVINDLIFWPKLFSFYLRNGFSINNPSTCCPCCKSSVYKRVQPDSSAAATTRAS